MPKMDGFNAPGRVGRRAAMSAMNAGESPTCPVRTVVDVIGGKWKLEIIFHLMQQTRRFNELQRLLGAITPQMLTAQLRGLEQDGLLLRTIYAEVPPRVEYALTDLGRSLQPVLQAMCAWQMQRASNPPPAAQG
jgi:DNA-binding HxlR family transcriptional regulator